MPKKAKTLDQFIKESENIHEGKYNYSKFIYVNCSIKGIIICEKHGEFSQSPSNHLAGNGCPKCSGKIKKTLEEFIKEANIIHKENFNYSKFIYVNALTKGIIICNLCSNEFLQSPSNHLSGHGCIKCTINKSKKSLETFIKEAKILHKNKYDYSKFQYINNSTKGIIICENLHEFFQEPSSHLKGQGCPKCAGNNRKSLETFIEEAKILHKDNYDYSKFIYINNSTKGIITCKKCKTDFLQSSHSHLLGTGCPKCSGKIKKTLDEFINDSNKVHKDNYTYNNFKYINNKTKGIIICKTHGEFFQNPHNHLAGNGCPKCSGSKTARILEEWFKKENINYISEYKVEGINGNNAYFDYYLKDHDTFIELDGIQHFKQVRNWKSPIEQLSSDIFKMKTEFKIIRLFQEDIWNKKFDFETLKEALNSKEKLICLPSKEIYKNHLFPWKVYSHEEIRKEFEELKKLPKLKMNSRTIIGNSCSDFFFQYHRLNTPNYNGNSAVDYFYNEREDIIKRAENKDLLKTITWLNHSPAQFSVYISYFIYQKFNTKKVFDPYAGWGDRCLAAISKDIKYIGCDSNPDLKESYLKMIDFFSGNNVKFFNCKSEEFLESKELEGVDLIFSSPPFYKKNGRLTEQYKNTETIYSKFLEESLIPLFKKFLGKVQIVLYIPENMKGDLNFNVKEVIKIDSKRNLYVF